MRLALILFGLLTLTGCASTYRLDSEVRSYARWSGDASTNPAAAGIATAIPKSPQTYRFERLPSQRDAGLAQGQEQLEAWARAALQQQGWTAAQADAPWLVQVSAKTVRQGRGPWDDPWGAWYFRGHFVAGNGHFFWSPSLALPLERPWYQREVSLVIRNSATGRVVYETRANNDGRWNSTPALWQAMLDSALRDFPSPPEGPRQVNIDLPR